ncbi:hypothetical protein CB1_000682002 [Camelus ferus]|nr:hypothetical protein CB1_000682002 [Camelus ferus]
MPRRLRGARARLVGFRRRRTGVRLAALLPGCADFLLSCYRDTPAVLQVTRIRHIQCLVLTRPANKKLRALKVPEEGKVVGSCPYLGAVKLGLQLYTLLVALVQGVMAMSWVYHGRMGAPAGGLGSQLLGASDACPAHGSAGRAGPLRSPVWQGKQKGMMVGAVRAGGLEAAIHIDDMAPTSRAPALPALETCVENTGC